MSQTPQPSRALVAHPPEVKERAYQLYAADNSLPQIAAELGIPASTIARWSSKNGWKARKTLIAGSAGSTADSSELPGFSDLSLPEQQDRYSEKLRDVALRFADHAHGLQGKELVQFAEKLLKADALSRKALKIEELAPAQIIQIALLSTPIEKRAQIDV
jgi:transposase-like protein